jgi:hypothetical protein
MPRNVIAIQRLREALTFAENITLATRSTASFQQWQLDTEAALAKLFGPASKQLKAFNELPWGPWVVSNHTTQHDRDAAFLADRDSAKAIIASAIREVEDYGSSGPDIQPTEAKPSDDIQVRVAKISAFRPYLWR